MNRLFIILMFFVLSCSTTKELELNKAHLFDDVFNQGDMISANTSLMVKRDTLIVEVFQQYD